MKGMLNWVAMTIIVRGKEPLLVVPPRLQRLAGFKAGDRLELKAKLGVITIATQPGVAGDEYTPEQKRAILEEVDEARKGPYHGPFKTSAEVADYLTKFKESKARSGKQPRSR